ncbi:unnamed protein product, partial [Amoebophrya sp. A25]|eukprot:GSA25T00011892001.1
MQDWARSAHKLSNACKDEEKQLGFRHKWFDRVRDFALAVRAFQRAQRIIDLFSAGSFGDRFAAELDNE